MTMSEWVKTSERLPTREDADEHDELWWSAGKTRVWLHSYQGYWSNRVLYWMPKPRQQPPKPPENDNE